MPTREQVRRLLDDGLDYQAASARLGISPGQAYLIAATRWGIFHAGLASAGDPKYTVVPQRQRLKERARANGAAGDPAGSAAGDPAGDPAPVPDGGGA